MSKHATMFTIVLCALALPVSRGSAQTSAADSATIDVQQAERLEREARDLLVDLRDLRGAASRLRQAATVRPASDPIALLDLATAAHVSFYRKDLRQAHTVMREAAERALAMGDVLRAAGFFVDVAHLAVTLNDGVGARTALERARLLSSSPLLSPVQRARLAARISPAPVVVADRSENGRR